MINVCEIVEFWSCAEVQRLRLSSLFRSPRFGCGSWSAAQTLERKADKVPQFPAVPLPESASARLHLRGVPSGRVVPSRQQATPTLLEPAVCRGTKNSCAVGISMCPPPVFFAEKIILFLKRSISIESVKRKEAEMLYAATTFFQKRK